ncbi:hypothetical protein E3P99_03524 [Wallemia hederae]|uniref:Uncharacterized protein n=1 Tax=Wallemia hederae TaxID=1540922 RepID=A0A4T0FG84_9BASI|nr:hypothetical protein E3P99_03524 [Wallemia hederae]
MTMFKLPDLSHRRADAVVALSTQSTSNNSNNLSSSNSTIDQPSQESRRMSATESLLMLSPKVRPVNTPKSTHTPNSMSTSLPQSNYMRKTRSASLAGSLPPSPPLTPATPIAFPSPRVAPVRKNSRDNSPTSLNDDPLDLDADGNDADAPFELDQVEEEEEEVVGDVHEQNTPVVFNMDSFKETEKNTASQTSSRSSSRGRKRTPQPLAPDESDSRGRSRHRNTSRGRS